MHQCLTIEQRGLLRAWLLSEAKQDRAIADHMDRSNTMDRNDRNAASIVERLRLDAFACDLIIRKIDRTPLPLQLPGNHPCKGTTAHDRDVPSPS